jgi:subtilisin family serine protease
LPAVPLQFRGLAPEAKIFSIAVSTDSVAFVSDAYLQQSAANHHALISNNSWHYANDTEYDLGAASYDAAVRDSLPGVSGSQPVLFVFSAGNSGQGSLDGTEGVPGTIQSPGTAKNVITVSAIEQPRFITNQTWRCITSDTNVLCQTNTPWLGLTDSSNQVAAFSSRGNIGAGIEGLSGRFKPDLVAPGTFVLSTRSTAWDQAAYYSASNSFLNPDPDPNYFACSQ